MIEDCKKGNYIENPQGAENGTKEPNAFSINSLCEGSEERKQG